MNKNLDKITPQLFMKEFDPILRIGEDPSGQWLKIRLSQVVHLLFGGQSGSGKSVFILQLFLQLLYQTNPKTLQFILIDPLKVSFKDFKELPHLLAPVGSTAQDWVKAVKQMMDINRERYTFLEGVWFENIYDYNKALAKDRIPYKGKDWMKKFVPLSKIPKGYVDKKATENYRLWEPMSQVVVIFDEFNALMLQETFGWKKPEDASSPALKNLVGISEQARKVWIIIVLGTQKISSATVPTKIRGNMKTKICLKVDSSIWSRTILWDTPENKSQGSKLVGYGDGLIYNLDLHPKKALRFQWANTEEEDIIDTVNAFIKAYWKNDFKYVQVNEEYAKDLEDLEMPSIDVEIFTEGMPDILVVQDSVFMAPPFQKMISYIVRNPTSWDLKSLALNYPSIPTKNLKIMDHQLKTAKILAMNITEEDEDLEEEKPKKKKKDEGYLGLNMKLRGLKTVIHELDWHMDPFNWDTEDLRYQEYMMKLLILRLNQTFIPRTKKLDGDIKTYL